MTTPKKTVRYYYWLAVEFIKKNIKLILLTFLLSFIFVIALVTIYPFLETHFFTKKEVIGLAGKYNLNNLPTEVTEKISNGLVYIKTDGTIIPALASSWEIKENGRTFLVHLKDNLVWNNGKKFTATEINYNFEGVKKKVIDDKTIVFTLKNPLPIFINYLNKPIIKPPLLGVGGLYRTGRLYSKYGKIKEIYLIPNKKNLPIIIYKFYDNDNQLIIAYKKGEISSFIVSKKSLVDEFFLWKNTSVTSSIDYNRLFTLFFNFKNQSLKERDIRSAIRMAINQKEFKDYGQIALGPIPPSSWAFNRNLKPYIYNSETANKIVDNMISATESANFKLATYYEYAELAGIIAEKLKFIGFKIQINYMTQSLNDDFDLLLAYWKTPSDPDQYYFWHSTQKKTNIGHYKNLKVDKLLEDGRNTYIVNERKAIYYDFQRIMNEDPPAVFLFYPYIYRVSRK